MKRLVCPTSIVMFAAVKLILSCFSQRLLCSWGFFSIGRYCNFDSDLMGKITWESNSYWEKQLIINYNL